MSHRLPGPERRQQLLDVALEVFGIGGYNAASMADIARAAGITKPVVYQHFDSKRSLYLEVLSECGHRMQVAVEKATASASTPREQVEHGIGAFVHFFDTNPAVFRTMFSDASRSDPEFARELKRVELVVAERIAALIEVDDLDGDERRMLAHAVIGVAETAVRELMRGRSGLDAERTAQLLANFIWKGLRGSASR